MMLVSYYSQMILLPLLTSAYSPSEAQVSPPQIVNTKQHMNSPDRVFASL